MQKILSALIALAMLMVLTPATSASESASYDYIGGGARVAGVGLGLSCHNFCLGDNNPFPGTSWGGARLSTPSGAFYNNAVISVQDDVWGTDSGFSACFWNPEGDNICDSEEDHPLGTDCGTRSLTNSPFAGDYITVFTYVFVVTPDDFDVCGASSGTATALFF